MDPQEFLDMMSQPGAADEMAFRIDKAHPDGTSTFSMEAVDGLAENAKAFLMARTFGRWQETGKPPTSMTMRLSIDWDDDSDLEEGGPWWQVDDEGTTHVIDGAMRTKAFEDWFNSR